MYTSIDVDYSFPTFPKYYFTSKVGKYPSEYEELSIISSKKIKIILFTGRK